MNSFKRAATAMHVLWFLSAIILPVVSDHDQDELRSHQNMLNHEPLPNSLKDDVHGVKMGVASNYCDNALDNLDVDWDGSPINYTCYHPKNPFFVSKQITYFEECYVPDDFYPKHKCMHQIIHYKDRIPTYGHHRPLWPIYGEYLFLPVQRWLHNLEHGAIVMLYHPCAEPLEVEKLRILLTNCLRRHIITPYPSLYVKRPLALLAWGCKLLMNHVDREKVISFIRKNALEAPEGVLAKEGQYEYKLIEKARVLPGSDFDDSNICPFA